MILLESVPQVENLYAFTYSGKKRLVLVLEVRDDSVYGWDFLADGYRTFNFDKMSSVKDFTDKLHVKLGEELYSKYEYADDLENKGYLVFVDSSKNLVYAVNYKQ